MSKEAFETFAEQSQSFFEPFMEANKLMMDKLQKLVDMQAKSAPGYAEMQLKQLQDISTIKDADSFKQFWDGQMAASDALHEKFLADSKALSDLGVSFLTELSELAEKNVNSFAAKASKKAA